MRSTVTLSRDNLRALLIDAERRQPRRPSLETSAKPMSQPRTRPSARLTSRPRRMRRPRLRSRSRRTLSARRMSRPRRKVSIDPTDLADPTPFPLRPTPVWSKSTNFPSAAAAPAAAADKGKGKGKSEVTEEEAKAVEVEADPEDDDDADSLIVRGPRKRARINYASVSPLSSKLICGPILVFPSTFLSCQWNIPYRLSE